MTELLFAIIEGEPYLSRAKKFRADMKIYGKFWSAIIQRFGATGHTGTGVGLNFGGGEPPKDWLKPTGIYGWSRPKKCNSEHEMFFDGAPNRPRGHEVFGKDIPNWIQYNGGDKEFPHGSFSLAEISIGWAGDTYIASFSDVKAAALNFLEGEPGCSIEDGADEWQMPVGLKEVTKAEIDLLLAEEAVRLEKEND